MGIPAYDPRPQNEPLQAEIKAALEGILASGRFIGGPVLEEFERAFAAHCGVEHAVGVSSGTDALLAALMALDVGPGDEVAVPTFTFFATAGVVSRLGARPRFIDVEPDTLNLSAGALDCELREVASRGGRIKAVIPVHLFGQPADLDAIEALAQEHGFAVIEDAAQATGARYREQPVGSRGVMGCFSFYPTKNLAGLGDGGLVVTRDGERAQTLRELRNHGMTAQYLHPRVGGNFRLDAFQAAGLAIKLPHLDTWNRQRRAIAERYRTGFEQLELGEFLRPPTERESGVHVYHQYVVQTTRRDELRAFLQEREIGSSIYYPLPLHQQPCFAPARGAAPKLPVAEKACQEVLALPMYPGLGEAEVDAVVEAVAAFFRG